LVFSSLFIYFVIYFTGGRCPLKPSLLFVFIVFGIAGSHIAPAAQSAVRGGSTYPAHSGRAGADHAVIGAVSGGGALLIQ